MNLKDIKLKEILRFLVGGGTAVIVDFILYHLFQRLGMETDLAKGISFFCGAGVGFCINKLWTFESKAFSKSECLRYIILYSITACINAAINKAVLAIVNISLIAFLAATGVSTVLNFLGQKFFVFHWKGLEKWGYKQ